MLGFELGSQPAGAEAHVPGQQRDPVVEHVHRRRVVADVDQGRQSLHGCRVVHLERIVQCEGIDVHAGCLDVEAVDDFLVDASEETHNVFEKTTSQVPAMDEARGDKSRGWETQRQRPGAFKKRRVRR